MAEQVLTLGIPVGQGKVLLGMKKRGFGAGRWNGFGGKIKEGETVEGCLKRECLEEAGIEVIKAERRGFFEFRMPSETFFVHLFLIQEFSGEPGESEEMRPEWFPAHSLPFDRMWPDDKH